MGFKLRQHWEAVLCGKQKLLPFDIDIKCSRELPLFMHVRHFYSADPLS